MSERLFYCGIAPPPRDPSRATQLMLSGSEKNINRDIEGIAAQMVNDVPDHLCDLLDIATYVFVADRMVRRGGLTLPNMGSDWRRRFRFVIAVRQPELWNAPDVNAVLQNLLGFLSEDIYHFKFVKSHEVPQFPSRLPLRRGDATPRRHDQVLLFSGGLDSLAGAVSNLSQTEHRVVLVSHRSSDWVFSRQKLLAQHLADQFRGRVLHFPVAVTMTGVLPDVEYTQRTRTFLFSAIGCVFAEMLGCAQIRFFENGIMSFNLPIAPQVVGSRATRSTHPRVLADMTSFAGHVLRRPFKVTNPFIWLTKTQVIRLIDKHGQADLIAHSISCTHVRKPSARAHCGECAQCLHRRFAVLAAGLADKDPDTDYEVELLLDPRENGEPRSMALSLVSSALEFPRLSPEGFMNRYTGEMSRTLNAFAGAPPESIVRQAYELHHRYGVEVRGVLEDAFRQHAPEIIGKTLAPSCLLEAVVADGRIDIDSSPLPDERAGLGHAQTELDTRDYRHSSQILLALDEDRRRILIDGIGEVGTASDFDLVGILVDQHRRDRAAELRPDSFKFVPTEALLDALAVDEVPLRQRISKFRKRIRERAREHLGVPLSKDAVIQNKSRSGYRLNPAVHLIDPGEVK